MPYAPDLAGCALDGRYELHAMIGDGTFGRVYRGRDRRLARTVAVKVMKPWWADDPHWAERFEREAQLLARVSDPGIVQIFDVGRAEEGLYYVAELVEGESLAARLRRGALAPREATQIAVQVCMGLTHAHEQGIVHGDIKPANVLISVHGQAKVADFGVAQLTEGSTEGGVITVIGTPRYMAPEQAQDGAITPAADVYSTGVLLYEMLVGSAPFRGDSAVELALRHLNDPPPSLPAGIPPALTQVVSRALAKQPADRYSGARDMAADLTGFLASPSASTPARTSASAPASARAPAPGPSAPAGVIGEDDSSVSAVGLDEPPTRIEQGRRPKDVDPTRVAPRMTPRRNVNPAARRRSVAALGLAFALLLGMIVAAVVLAAGPSVRLPDVVGLSKRTITARMRRADLQPRFTSHYDRAATGTAIRQTPAPGTRVPKGSKVLIALSQGPPPVEVPKLTGQSSEGASAILQSLGLAASINPVPAPGVRPGVVTHQSRRAGTLITRRSRIVLSVAEAPRWRLLTSFAGDAGGRSVVFRIRGTQWRVVYRMSYVGTCSLIFFCSGPSAQVVDVTSGSDETGFGLNDGGSQSHVVQSGAGLYQIRIVPGSDTARWSMEVQDYY